MANKKSRRSKTSKRSKKSKASKSSKGSKGRKMSRGHRLSRGKKPLNDAMKEFAKLRDYLREKHGVSFPIALRVAKILKDRNSHLTDKVAQSTKALDELKSMAKSEIEKLVKKAEDAPKKPRKQRKSKKSK